MTRRLRQLFCHLLIGTLLFSQWSVASYACPALSPQGEAAPTVAAFAGDCDQMAGMPDPASPNLCAGHCQQGHQSADRAPAPTLAAALLASFYPWPVVPEGAHLDVPLAAASSGAGVAASPPHEILHCCFRL